MNDSSDSYYFIQNGLTQDGPYDLDSLRQLLAVGRLSPVDRVQRTRNREVVSLITIIPEADEIKRSSSIKLIVRNPLERQKLMDKRKVSPMPLPIKNTVKKITPVMEQSGKFEICPVSFVANRTKFSSLRFKVRFLVVPILAIIAFLVWRFPIGKPDSGPFPIPDIPTLTVRELTNFSDQQLLSLVERECMRRMLVSGLDLRVSSSILSPHARHIFTIIEGENVIRSFGIHEQLRIERNPTLGATRPLASMIESYRSMSMEQPAHILAKALSSPSMSLKELREVEVCYLKVIDQESSHKLVVYAKKHLIDLFPDLSLKDVKNK